MYISILAFFFGNTATADVFIFRVIYESPLFVENSIFPIFQFLEFLLEIKSHFTTLQIQNVVKEKYDLFK